MPAADRRAAGGGAEHAIKGIHDDFQRLDSGLLPWRLASSRPCQMLVKSPAGNVFLARTRHRENLRYVLWIRLRHAFHQPDGINQKGRMIDGYRLL